MSITRQAMYRIKRDITLSHYLHELIFNTTESLSQRLSIKLDTQNKSPSPKISLLGIITCSCYNISIVEGRGASPPEETI
jgi:hypothetical protein